MTALSGLRSVVLLIPACLLAGQADDLLARAEALIKSEDLPAAERLLVEAKKLGPENTPVLYRLGYVQFRQRELKTAREHFQAVVRLAPPAYYSRYFLGRIALLENDPAAAVQWLEPILKDKQEVFDTSAQLASAYADLGRNADAVEALNLAIAESPWDAGLHYRLGRLYAKLGQKQLADEALKQSTRLRNTSREDVGTLMEVARLAAEGKRSEALTAGATIRERADADPNALIALGVVYGKAGLQAEALDVFQRATAVEPDSFQAQYNRGLALLKLNQAAAALEALARSVEILPESPDANKAYGLAAVLNQRYADALTPLERARRAFPSDVRLGALLATAYLRAGDGKRALELLSEQAFVVSDDPAPHLLRIEALNATEDPEGALKAAETARKRFPTVPQAHLALAQQLARVGRYSDAKPVFAEAVNLMPGNPEAVLGLADTLARSGEHAEAVQRYNNVLTNPRTSATARAGLGRSLIALRRFEEAAQLLQDSVRIHPSDAPLYVELSRAYARLGKAELAAEQARIAERLTQTAGQR